MLRLGLLLVFTLLLSWPCLADEAESVQLAESMVMAINDRDLDRLDQLVSQNVVRHSAATAGVVVTNLTEFKAFLESDFLAVPDSVMTIDVIFGNQDYVAMRAIYSGTQSGQMGPFPPTDKRFELPFIGILKIDKGKISEIWVEWDNVFALSQLGHLAPPSE
jgi:predicted ester cyclase